MTISIMDSTSVEALAFNYLRFGLFAVINNLWTLVAVVTAAVSFWRFKLAPSLAKQHSRFVTQDTEKPIPAPPMVENVAPVEFTAAATTPCQGGGDGGVVRRKLYCRFFYEAIEQSDEAAAAAEEEEEIDLMHEDETTREYDDDDDQCFDVSERLRKWDLGFYDFQDLSVLDGNVVRLWDSCRVSLSPRSTTVRPATITTVSGGEMWF